METQNPTSTTTPEIPEIKLAGVRKKEDRKKGGFGLFGGGNAVRGGFSGATGGLGGGVVVGGSFIGNLIAQIGQNIGVFAFVAAVGLAAAGYGKMRAPEYKAYKDAKKEGFATKQKPRYEGDFSRLPTNRAASGDSLGMISGSLDGKTPEQRAKEAADAEAKAKADAEAKAKAEADAKAKEEAAAKAAAPDPAAMMAGMGVGPAVPSAAPEAKGLGHGKIGGLSTSLGGGGTALAGGAGMSGGIGGSFGGNKFDPNKLLAMKAAPQASRSSGPSTPSYKGIGRGKALRQLDKTAHYSNLARNGANESRSTNASAPFDNNTPGGDRITGAGARDGTSPKDSTPDANPSPNSPGQGGGNPVEHSDGLQNCPNGVRAVKCVDATAGVSVDPTDGIVSMLHTLMMITAILAAIQFINTKLLKIPFLSQAVAGEYALLTVIIGGLGVAIAALGVTLMTMGRPIMGGICTAIGAITAIFAFAGSSAAEEPWKSLAERAILPLVGTFLKNPDHKMADSSHPGQLTEGGGGWF